MKYFTKLPDGEPNKFLADSFKEIFDVYDYKKILCVGGGAGRLGRCIAKYYPNALVTEVDSSKEMVELANTIAIKENLKNRFISIKADARLLPFQSNEFDYVIAYGVFRYIDTEDQQKVLSEIARVSKDKFTIAEPKEKGLIYNLKKEFYPNNSLIIETQMNMSRMSLFYMLLKEYKINKDLKSLTDSFCNENIDNIDILTSVAGVFLGTLYELRVGILHEV